MFAILLCFKAYSQDSLKRYDVAFSPELIWQGKMFGGVNLTVGAVVINKVIAGMSGMRIGVESNFLNNSDFIIAPKVGYEISTTLIAARLLVLPIFKIKTPNSDYCRNWDSVMKVSLT